MGKRALSIRVIDYVLRSEYGGAGLKENGSSGSKIDGPWSGSEVADAKGGVLVVCLKKDLSGGEEHVVPCINKCSKGQEGFAKGREYVCK